MKSIRHFRELDVYQEAMSLVMRVTELNEVLSQRRTFCLNRPDQEVQPINLRELGRGLEKEAI